VKLELLLVEHRTNFVLDIEAPHCTCGGLAVERTVVKEGSNKGRQFWACSKGQTGSCGFFEWKQEGARDRTLMAGRKRSLEDGSVSFLLAWCTLPCLIYLFRLISPNGGKSIPTPTM
jgi:hypothetical protein